jgi:AAA15 family ATPase/GTPase
MRTIKVENYKSIHKLKLDLGRITVFIGENGCGKSNILEAIALASAAAGNKLDNEFLVSRGIRVTDPQFMRSAFAQENILPEIKISILGQNQQGLRFFLQNDNRPYSKWVNQIEIEISSETLRKLNRSHEEILTLFRNKLGNIGNLKKSELELIDNLVDLLQLEFLIYSPEIYSLQTFQKEGQIQPLGIHGEGLFKLLKVLKADKNHEKISKIKEKLRLIDWFQDFEFSQNASDAEHFIKIKDRYLEDNVEHFDQKSSNEGFLFLLFYFALFISDDTPKFFAIDNIDASLNPRLCRRVMKELIQLAQEHDKQVIFTTHNPAILDGLNLEDEEQKLYVIYRNLSGYTQAKQILKPESLPGKEPVKLSEAFLRGYLGGLPKNF